MEGSSGRREGDMILIMAVRQIGSPVPDELDAVTELIKSPDLWVDIVVRSLWLITDGEAKFPVQLPPGVAARHRICTLIARKIKDLGYAGDCGYNQLLYPTEVSTRQLLVWLVEKLPRMEEEVAEEALTPRAQLNRRIKSALEEWCRTPWRLHFYASETDNEDDVQDIDALDQYTLWHFRTFPLIVHDLQSASDEGKLHNQHVPPLITAQVPNYWQIAPSVFEASSLDAAKAALREERMMVGDGAEERPMRGMAVISGPSDVAIDMWRQALTQAMQKREGDMRGGERVPDLTDLMADLGRKGGEAERVQADFRPSRFAHAVNFAHDDIHVQMPAFGDSTGRPTPTAATLSDGAETSGAPSSEEWKEAARKEAERVQHERQAEIAMLQAQLEKASEQYSSLEKGLEVEKAALTQAEAELATLAREKQELEKDYLLKKKALELLPNASEHIAKLQEICAASSQRLMDLGEEWEKHRRPLVDAIRRAKEKRSRRKEGMKEMVEEIKRCRHDMQQMVQDIKEKEERAKLLQEEYRRLGKNINRNMYTHRILDIIQSISKQQQGIESIIADIREVQKEINTVSATLSRTDAIADEKIFKAANDQHKDAALIAAYRQLTDLRQRFERVVSTVREIGQKDTECRDVEAKIKLLQSRLTTNEMYERITQDLEQIRGENAALLTQLRNKG